MMIKNEKKTPTAGPEVNSFEEEKLLIETDLDTTFPGRHSNDLHIEHCNHDQIVWLTKMA